ncbi:MAG: AraC family transcriptional regulator [Tannerella sp.]|nr:AraC family transcriptional regulator [Tannerella sp.]
MAQHHIYIKNMVCNRCIMVVQDIFHKLEIQPVSVTLGEVVLNGEPEKAKQEEMVRMLNAVGFELIDSRKVRLIEQVKKLIIELVRSDNMELRTNLSDYLSDKIHHDYTYISNMFSEAENITIEKYFIAQKIERVKELLVYDELSLNEIAEMLNYSSAAHLSSQFKKVTGLTPTHFKQIKENKRKSLDQV